MDLRQTSLYAEHVKLNAKMAPFADFAMPIQYTTVKDEVAAVRQKVGIFDVSHMGEFFIEGPEANDFVDYLMTNDFKNSEPHKAVYSPLCNDEGHILDDLIAYKINDQTVLICVNAANVQKDWAWVSSHVGKFKCVAKNLSDDFSLLAVQGPQTVAVLKKIGLDFDDRNFPYYSVKSCLFGSSEVIMARTGYTGEDGFEIFCSHQLAPVLWNKLLQEKVTPCGLAARDILRLEVGYPLYGHELNEQLTPADCGVGWAVKKDKASFIGRDALRTNTPVYQAVKLSLGQGIPRAGYPITNAAGEVIGEVSSGTISPTLNQGIALGRVKRAVMPADKVMFIQIRGKNIPATFHQKPFITGGHK
jgi:aminomethyltransferase